MIVMMIFGLIASRPSQSELSTYTFEKYEQDFLKKYTPFERSLRRHVFYTELAEINKHNQKPGILYRKGVNHLTDRTKKEKASMNGYSRTQYPTGKTGTPLKIPPGFDMFQLPSQVDWRKNIPPVLTAVKDQGLCGSCYAFSAIESVETYVAMNSGDLFSFSAHQAMMCTPNPTMCGGTGGCYGGKAELVFDYFSQSSPTQEYQDPYISYHGYQGSCMESSSNYVTLSGYTAITDNSQEAMMYALVKHGPLSVNVDASHWHSYESGIFNGCGDYRSRNITMNHVVQLVGYGTDADLGVDYWIVRNSWSPNFGEKGYIRLYKSKTPMCGWDVDTHHGFACDNQPNIQYTCGECGILYGASFPN